MKDHITKLRRKILTNYINYYCSRIHNLNSCEIKECKKHTRERLNLWPPRYRWKALPAKLLPAQAWIFFLLFFDILLSLYIFLSKVQIKDLPYIHLHVQYSSINLYITQKQKTWNLTRINLRQRNKSNSACCWWQRQTKATKSWSSTERLVKKKNYSPNVQRWKMALEHRS